MAKLPDLETIYTQYREEDAIDCGLCELSQSRNNIVWSRGNNAKRLMIVGEAPGENEDKLGLPFIGESGKLLQNIFRSVGLDVQLDCYVCNVVKCRPPNNRQPSAKECNTCFGYLAHQIAEAKPLVVVAMGGSAAKFLIDERPFSITKNRGRFYEISKKFEQTIVSNYNNNYSLKVMPTFHPSALLRENKPNLSPGSNRWHVWNDVKAVKQMLDSI